ncbi:MAG TPA: hypothetical protein VGW80_04700 [Solirubrobacterales bacterium]|jgi:hypothetical protein|nr:hypothetical protein [Solirubrobacterales bacterium]
MPPQQDQSHLVRRLQNAAAELDDVVHQVRGVEQRVGASIGASATAADRRMLSALGQVSGSARGAQQALSAAAGGLRNLP